MDGACWILEMYNNKKYKIMTEHEFWEAYLECEKEKYYEPETTLLIDYCNNEGITRYKIPIENACESKQYRGCFEADCLSSYYENERTGGGVTTSRRTFSYKNVIRAYQG